MTQHKIVSRQEWLEARRALLAQEKALTRAADAVSAQRRALPWVKLTREYVFDAPGGWRSLADVFESSSQLIVYHFMFAPGWKEACVGCSFAADHLDGVLPHLSHRDVAFAAVSRASLAEIEAFRARMGWRFPWLSSQHGDFSRDFGASFAPEDVVHGKVVYNYELREVPCEDMPGLSVFFKHENGDIFHTYSTFARGCEVLLGTYRLLDLVPKGRGEGGLSPPMAWVRHHDRYPDAMGYLK